ncbi:PP0621 family protein [Ramlibacter sp. MAHUQ-53]|uniref:PP0621 family protein n=1 Tax=unclassified Ramlibacter TaxID=2617605 RepID=UPI00362650F2
MKYLVLFAVLAVIYLVWKHQRQTGARPGAGAGAPGRNQAPRSGQPQAMVRCAACAVHLPQADAVADAQGRLFCSPEHREEYRATPTDTRR